MIKKISNEIKLKAVELYISGKTSKEISQILNVSSTRCFKNIQ